MPSNDGQRFCWRNSTNGVPVLVAKALSVPHGFFGRRGGVSQGACASLNFRIQDGEHPEHIAENVRLAAQAIHVSPARICRLRQVHGCHVATIDQHWHPHHPPIEADIAVSSRDDVTLSVSTADCVPILACDTTHGVIGVCHSGWRGTAANAPGIMVQSMIELGAQPPGIVAAIGPAIAPENYPVNDDVYQKFPASWRNQIFQIITTDNDSGGSPVYSADLVRACQILLQRSGVGTIAISGWDTYSHNRDFFSYRRERDKPHTPLASLYGTQISMISLSCA